MRTEFVKYNRERLPPFQTETTIVSDQKGRRFVRKRSLTMEGEAHVLRLNSAYEMMVARLDHAKVPRPTQKGAYLVFDFIEGESIEEALMKATISGDHNGFRVTLQRYTTLLRSYGTTTAATFIPRGGLEMFFITDHPLRDEECMKVANLDLTFDNIIVDAEGGNWITDYEWVYDSPVPLDFIIFRSLYVFYLKHSNYAPEMIPFEEALSITGVRISKRDMYARICESFIDQVFGKDRRLIIPNERMQPVWRFLDTATGKQADSTMASQQEMITEMSATIAQKHDTITHLSNENEALRTKEAELATEIGSLKNEIVPGLRELISQTEAKLIIESRERDKFRSLSEELSESLSSTKTELTTLSSELEQERSVTDALRIRTTSLSELVEKQDQEILDAKKAIEKGNADLMAKQSELMAMSDWAYRMKLRLEFIDSKPFVRNAERYYRLQDEAMDKLRSQGIKEFTRAAMLKFLPRRAKQWMLNDQPVDQGDLEKSVEASGGRVMVVFPIIPWEFRWQRPQQIVSRFASNGYTVLFVSLNIMPRGRAYKNEKEAATDVTLGRLDENVFQVWLSSESKLDIYHDHIEGRDAENLELGLRAVLRTVHAKKKIFMVQFPSWSEVALSMRKKVGGHVIFDCMDDHSGFTNATDKAISSENKLLKGSDLVITTSTKLYDRAKSLSDRVVMVKNGTDFDQFSKLAPNGQLDRMQRPIIGYYGAISDWFDTELIEHAARSRPDWSFVLIGSTVGCDTSGLERLSNVHLLGEKPYKELPGFLYYFDVCTIPFKITPLTLATNPVKFYEYMSSGKPMVSVRLPELEPYGEFCYFADSKEEFVSMIQKALDQKDDEGLRRMRIEFAKQNSWDQRFDVIAKNIEDL